MNCETLSGTAQAVPFQSSLRKTALFLTLDAHVYSVNIDNQEPRLKTRGKQGERMNELLVGNAPCSWGTLEHQDQSQAIPSTQMLDELVETGYTGTELGDWGYMPTDPARLSEELSKRNNVAMLGAFVPVELKNPLAHAEGTARAVKTAQLIAAVATTQAPFLVLADDNGTDPRRTKLAGRVPASAGLNKD